MRNPTTADLKTEPENFFVDQIGRFYCKTPRSLKSF